MKTLKDKRSAIVLRFLTKNVDREPIRVSQLQALIGTATRKKCSRRRIVEIINQLRRSGQALNLIASGNGYTMTTDIKKLEEYEQRLRRQAAKVLAVAECVREYRRNQKSGIFNLVFPEVEKPTVIQKEFQKGNTVQ